MNKFLITLILLTISATILLFASKPIASKNITKQIDSLVVNKTLGKLIVYNKKKLLKIYDCGVGGNMDGNKQKEGDNRTPEGKYYLTDKSAASSYYKNFHISYPNDADRARCKKAGVPTGGDIKIHGYANSITGTAQRNSYFSSTWGCVSVTNNDMDELFKWVIIGSPIYIKR
jgi:murein L,D-transpeptidase YafK